MSLDAWLPIGYSTPNGEQVNIGLYEGRDWQIYMRKDGGNILIVKNELYQRWIASGLLEEGIFNSFLFGGQKLFSASCPSDQMLAPIGNCKSPGDKNEAMAFADALRITRNLDSNSGLHDAIYIEKYTRILPTYTLSPQVSDDIVFGSWLTGGIPISVKSFRRLKSCMSWIPAKALQEIVGRAGFEVQQKSTGKQQTTTSDAEQIELKFELAGRPDLERFLSEHVIDIIENEERYKTLGIDFPSAIVLYGPPGCGKTFAVEKLVDYLGWPSFEIEATSVASPFIHETSKKVAELFEKAIQNAPSVLVIDEMESFLADRQMGGGSSHHRVEEVAEFLRKIPEAIKNRVLIIAMTNRIEMIDPAILRRGRFDHIVKVDMPSEGEVHSLLINLVAELPCDKDIDISILAKKLQGRPLSDVSFTVREGARLSARAGKDRINQESLMLALESSPSRENELGSSRKIGF